MKLLVMMVVFVASAASAAVVNLLANPGFEEQIGADNWSTKWGTFSVESWNNPPEGNAAAYIKGNWDGGEDNNGGMIQALPVSPNVEYTVRAKLYLDNGWKAETKAFKLEFFNEQGLLLNAFIDDLADLKDGRWTERVLRGVAPRDAVLAQVVLEAAGIGSEGVLGVDNFVMEEGGAPKK